MVAEDGDIELATDLFKVMEGQHVDFTLFFRGLVDVVSGQNADISASFNDPAEIDQWLTQWQARLAKENTNVEIRLAAMNKQNPIYIPRNHQVEKAISAATDNHDYDPFEAILEVLLSPFEKRQGLEEFEQPAPESFGPYRTFCGT
jgi:uncharacterized protein YdiU (UPF0061 family)